MSDDECIDHHDATGRALDWVSANIGEFEPFHADGSLDVSKIKPLVELAIMTYAYVAITGDRDNPRIAAAVDLLRSVQGRRAFTDQIIRSPRHFTVYASFYAVLRLLGHDDPNQRALVQRAVAAGYPAHIERPPHRMMDVRLALEWGDVPSDLPNLGDLAGRSILSRPLRAALLDDSAVYALTHVILFGYAFGTRPHWSFDALDGEEPRRLLSTLMVVACQTEHWDLLGELLLCWLCLGFPDEPLYRRAWAAFLATQGPDGAFPGPAPANQASDEDPEDDAFTAAYHTTLVAIMALAKRGRPRPVARARSGARRSPTGPYAAGATAQAAVAAATAAEGWLERIVADAAAPPRRHALSGILLGTWMCAWLTGDPHAAYPALVERVGPLLAAGDATSVPARTELMAAGLLARDGRADVRTAAAAVIDAASALAARAPDDDPAMFGTRLTLHDIGAAARPPSVTAAAVGEHARALSLSAGPREVDALLAQIESLTRLGTKPAVLRHEDAWLSELLAGFMAHAFRTADLARGARAARALAYLAADDSAMAGDLELLCLQQTPTGAFGFYGPEEATLDLPHDSSVPLDLHLPVTLACLWAIGEAAPGRWRLHAAYPLAPTDAAGGGTATRHG